MIDPSEEPTEEHLELIQDILENMHHAVIERDPVHLMLKYDVSEEVAELMALVFEAGFITGRRAAMEQFGEDRAN